MLARRLLVAAALLFSFTVFADEVVPPEVVSRVEAVPPEGAPPPLHEHVVLEFTISEEGTVSDIVVIRPGQRFPVDGVVVAGESAVNQAPVTGESWPAEKGPGDEVFAGSINGDGALEVEAVRPASDSTIARIVRLVEQAQLRRAPIQTFVERFARRYTPAVVGLAIVLAVVPPLLLAGADGWTRAFGEWSYRGLALLVVACPCALVISTPVSIVSALTSAARHGVLIKGGSHLERLGSVRCLAFDKTGTLTHNRVIVTEVLGVDGVSTSSVLSVAAALESRSEHPIGRAIVDRARTAGLDVVPGLGFRALPGLGAEAVVAAAPAIIGSHRLFEERRLCTSALHARVEEVQERGGTPVLVSHGGEALGVIGLADRPRDAGREVVAGLRELGVEPIESEGRRFDPNLHEAVATVASEGVEPGTVAREVRRGWRLGDELLRAAQVVVAAPPEVPEPWR